MKRKKGKENGNGNVASASGKQRQWILRPMSFPAAEALLCLPFHPRSVDTEPRDLYSSFVFSILLFEEGPKKTKKVGHKPVLQHLRHIEKGSTKKKLARCKSGNVRSGFENTTQHSNSLWESSVSTFPLWLKVASSSCSSCSFSCFSSFCWLFIWSRVVTQTSWSWTCSSSSSSSSSSLPRCLQSPTWSPLLLRVLTAMALSQPEGAGHQGCLRDSREQPVSNGERCQKKQQR